MDTRPEADAVQLELLRSAPAGRCAEVAFMLSDHVIRASRRGLRDQHPHANEQEIGLLWMRMVYGAELADRVRDHLASRARE